MSNVLHSVSTIPLCVNIDVCILGLQVECSSQKRKHLTITEDSCWTKQKLKNKVRHSDSLRPSASLPQSHAWERSTRGSKFVAGRLKHQLITSAPVPVFALTINVYVGTWRLAKNTLFIQGLYKDIFKRIPGRKVQFSVKLANATVAQTRASLNPTIKWKNVS